MYKSWRQVLSGGHETGETHLVDVARSLIAHNVRSVVESIDSVLRQRQDLWRQPVLIELDVEDAITAEAFLLRKPILHDHDVLRRQRWQLQCRRPDCLEGLDQKVTRHTVVN